MRYLLIVLMLMGCGGEEFKAKTEYVEPVAKDKTTYKRIAFIGNSITYHYKSTSLGWDCACGMAASAPDKDFDYIVTDHFKADQYVVSIASWERSFSSNEFTKLLDLHLFQPDLVIVNLGENMNTSTNKETMIFELENLYFEIIANTSAKVIYVDSFYNNANTNDSFNEFAVRNSVPLVKVGDLYVGKYKRTEHPHAGVASHPNDLGHEEIALRIIKTTENN